jgi:hypothetical protein
MRTLTHEALARALLPDLPKIPFPKNGTPEQINSWVLHWSDIWNAELKKHCKPPDLGIPGRKMGPCAMHKLLLIVVIQIMLGTVSYAKPWRGIVPLHSTREDVERLLGKPNAKYGRYEFDKEIAEISYSTGLCVNGWKVPTGTVIDIVVSPKESLRISDLKLDLSKYERVRDPKVTSHVYYANRDDGMRYVAYEPEGTTDGKILTTYYESTTEDVRNLYCKPNVEGIRADPGILASSISSLKVWREIVPLHSTRADVEKLIGSPMQPNGITYDLKSERVNVVYSAGSCEKDRVEWNVPTDTVIGIMIYPQKRLMLPDLGFALDKFDKFINPQNPDFIAYSNKEEGMGFGAKPSGEVQVIQYFPAAKDSHLRCPNFSPNRVTMGELEYFKFDEFSNLSRGDERARLNNFATRLSSRPDTKAYVIVYPGKREKVSIATARANRIKSYLVNTRRIDSARVDTIVGRRMESSKTKLFVVPTNITVERSQK